MALTETSTGASIALAQGSPTLARVVGGELCAGCGLCAGVSGGAVTMSLAAPGYARPEAIRAVSPEAEAVIAAACPGATVARWDDGQFLGLPTHPYWGPYHAIYTGHATDAELRFAGSSGGLVSALALFALTSGRVDAVAHIRADPARPTHNVLTVSRDRAGVLGGAGSRYGASSPLASIDALLNGTDRIAFIGKPCDVSALRLLGRRDPRVAERIPIILSFFCGGMPSLAGTDRVIRAMGIDPAAVTAFRYRGMGWPGEARAETADGAVGRMSYNDSWGAHLSKAVQFRCKICPDAVGGVADIACADAWYGGESGYPSFVEADGRSLVITRTDAGTDLLQAALTAGICAVEPCAVEAIDAMQPGQVRRKRVVRARSLAARLLLQPVPQMAGLMVREAARRAQWGEALRNLLGTLRRIVKGQR
jgi:coenzyme F420 hydrogenase subunit beta